MKKQILWNCKTTSLFLNEKHIIFYRLLACSAKLTKLSTKTCDSLRVTNVVNRREKKIPLARHLAFVQKCPNPTLPRSPLSWCNTYYTMSPIANFTTCSPTLLCSLHLSDGLFLANCHNLMFVQQNVCTKLSILLSQYL